MSGKFAIFFLVVACLVQGFQSRNVEPRSVIDDAITAIKNVIEKVKNALSEITKQIPEIIENLKNKIEEIISNIHIDEIIQSIQDKIQEAVEKILTLAGVDPEDVKDCIDAEKEAVKKLTEDTIAGIAACKQAADDEVAELAKEMEELKVRADKLIKDSTSSISQCIKDHGIHIIEVVKCLNGHLEELKKDTEDLVAQIKNTIKVGKDKLGKVPIDLAKCIANVNSEALKTQKKIIDDFKTCVDNHGQGTEQPEQ